MSIEEIDIEKLGRSFSFRENEAYSAPITIFLQDARLVRASVGEANVYLSANIVNRYGQAVHIIGFFKEHVEIMLRAEQDRNWSSKPSPFTGSIEGILSDWVRGVGLTLKQCEVVEDAS